MAEVTELLSAAESGDPEAIERLFARVYAELKRIAHRQLGSDPGATLNTTGLVHEAYLKLDVGAGINVAGRAHFFALAARAMRQIVIDHARARIAVKRGGSDVRFVDLDQAHGVAEPETQPEVLLRLDEALGELAATEPRLASLVEMRYFAGLSIAEIADLRGVSERTLNRDWRRARAQLFVSLGMDVQG